MAPEVSNVEIPENWTRCTVVRPSQERIFTDGEAAGRGPAAGVSISCFAEDDQPEPTQRLEIQRAGDDYFADVPAMRENFGSNFKRLIEELAAEGAEINFSTAA